MQTLFRESACIIALYQIIYKKSTVFTEKAQKSIYENLVKLQRERSGAPIYSVTRSLCVTFPAISGRKHRSGTTAETAASAGSAIQSGTRE